MTEALSHFINDAGWLAPLYYVLSFVVTALLPFIPTPLVGALGGAAFGVVPAILYGIVGLGLGAAVALNLSRRIGRPIVLKLVSPTVWAQWEALLGIRSVVVWGVIFFVLNVDFAVVAAGLSGIAVRKLWLTAMVARFPWLVASAWFGDLIFVSDTVMLLALVVMLGMLVVLGKVRPVVHGALVRWVERNDAAARRRNEARTARERARSGAGRDFTALFRSWRSRRPRSAAAAEEAPIDAPADDPPRSSAPAPDGAGAPEPGTAAPRDRDAASVSPVAERSRGGA
jgi:uncharacterized membrane protein YdjX (TVP38/TMEM64 family)